jgi:hypothetical protein
MGSQMNSDNLFVKIGVTKATPNVAGEYKTYGAERMIEIHNLDLTTLTTTPIIVSDQTFWPANRKISYGEVIANTGATTGTSAALDIGLIQTDRTTVMDSDGLLDSIAVANFSAAGEKFMTGDTDPAAGDLGAYGATAPTTTGYITAATSTGTFTAGNVTVRLFYRTV